MLVNWKQISTQGIYEVESGKHTFVLTNNLYNDNIKGESMVGELRRN
jgi:hypothetical protein